MQQKTWQSSGSKRSYNHSRRLTTAGKYLCLKLFDMYDLGSEQQASLDQIVQFIVDACVLSFFEILVFHRHACTWMNPKTAAHGVLQADMDIS